MTGPDVMALVVNYGTAELTIECVRSLLASEGVSVAVVVIDNASPDDSVGRLRDALPGVRLVARARNDGYAGGNNVGFALAAAEGARYAFVVNSDAFVEPGCLARLVAAADGDARIAIVSPCIVYPDPADGLWFGGSRFSLWTGRAEHVGRRQPRWAGLPVQSDITFATGCAMLVRTSALAVTGPFDAALFAYAEDLDLSLRTRALGYRTVYVPSAVVTHHEGVSHVKAGGQALRVYLHHRNLLRVLRRHASWYHWLTITPVFLVDSVARHLFLRARAGDLAGIRAVFSGIAAAFTGGRHPIEPAP
ncbi:MAG: hypothetical protein JWL60_298 [Gemmatimonadetes bacterium]|nr:hypothetical protein [Gemmatimonadota bacterium]